MITTIDKHSPVELVLGVKTDPIEYRYSFAWLFDLLEEEGVRYLQLGTFFELYQLPDDYFRDLRRQAEDRGLSFASVFTAHRELGGFFRDDGPGWESVARRNYERLIEVASLVGASCVGSNPGAVLRDRMGTKGHGLARYLRHTKELMGFAADHGIEWLTIEPMSCLAEPPTLPEEMRVLAEDLAAYHDSRPDSTCQAGFCVDVAHGYADAEGQIIHNHLDLLRSALPWTSEIHLKNTDAMFNATFGFAPDEREKGVVDLATVRDTLKEASAVLPVNRLVGYLEIGGPKLGRDYTDPKLGDMLRQSLCWCRKSFEAAADGVVGPRSRAVEHVPAHRENQSRILIAPSLMCADMCRLGSDVHQLESAGVDLWHLDIIDGHFAPNLPLGLCAIEQLRPKTAKPFDVHLMVNHPDWLIDRMAGIGVESICVHVEACPHLERTLQRIRAYGIRAGAALNPATPLYTIEWVLHAVDYVVLMTVNPGFAGQKLVTGAIEKIAACRQMLDTQTDRSILIEVDGNVSFANIPPMVAAGADILVAGTSSVFGKAATLRENMAHVREAVTQGLSRRNSSAGVLRGVAV